MDHVVFGAFCAVEEFLEVKVPGGGHNVWSLGCVLMLACPLSLSTGL